MQKPFDNVERIRYYGIRIGDIVSPKRMNGKPHTEDCEVIDYGFMDNNKVVLKSKDGKEFPWVAEWCKIVTKVEHLNDKPVFDATILDVIFEKFNANEFITYEFLNFLRTVRLAEIDSFETNKIDSHLDFLNQKNSKSETATQIKKAYAKFDHDEPIYVVRHVEVYRFLSFLMEQID